jgi:hypothetical protein
VWLLLSLGMLLLGLHLLRMPWAWLGFLPLLMALKIGNLTALLVGLLLIGIWAARARRWGILGLIVALTIPTPPAASTTWQSCSARRATLRRCARCLSVRWRYLESMHNKQPWPVWLPASVGFAD